YYGGAPPEVMRFGSAWPDANFQLVDQRAVSRLTMYVAMVLYVPLESLGENLSVQHCNGH
ncbi:MAG TPA: hypothetical protein VL135_00200, partial [Terracidiphilus sp.]|nr:hypothetical protein [Terracidiphilus sp.]